jgi:hypothetical protein
MGMEAGVPRVKSRRQQWREQPDADPDSLQRSWGDVNKARVVFCLAAAGILPTALFWLWIGLEPDDFAAPIVTGIVFSAFAMTWFVGAGSLFLFWLGQTHGVVERFNCLALCATLSFFMPLVVLLVAVGLSPSQTGADFIMWVIFGAGFGGLVVSPLGLIGGWILWRIAIRPAARPLKEIAEVF